MKKLLSLTLAFALLLSMMAPMAFASQSGEVLKTDTAPTIDGQIDAVWENANVYEMKNYNVAEKDNAKLDPVKSADDFSGQWRALWDDKYFYTLVEITDDVITDLNYQRDGGTHSRDDSVRILLGQEGNNHLIALFHIKTKDMYYLSIGPNEWSERNKDDVKYTVTEVSGGYIVEAAIPWEIAGVNPLKPQAGGNYKFDVQAVDNDFLENERNEIGIEGRYPQSRLSWSYDKDALTPETVNPFTAELGTITLAAPSNDSGAGSEAPADTPAAGGSDAPASGGSDNVSTPGMPKTGMGGASENMTTWAVLAVFIAAIAAVGVMKLRRNN